MNILIKLKTQSSKLKTVNSGKIEIKDINIMNTLFQKDLVTVESLNPPQIELIFQRALELKQLVENIGGDNRLKGKIMTTLFYEPSSRTFSSFITSIQRLGGGIIPLQGMNNTSVAKGETLEDTVRVFSNYADIMVIRHNTPGSVELAAEHASIPVINAGDGINEHPSQALTDLFTIKEKFHDINNLHLLIIGDLAHYRPTNSLMKLLVHFPGVKLSLVTPVQVPIQDGLRAYLKKNNVNFKEYNDFRNILSEADVLYITRVKKEYMSEDLYSKVKGSYIVDKKMIGNMKKDSLIMHCLPRIDEISTDVDSDPRAVYFSKQVRNGLYVRMAIIDLILRK